MSLPGGRRAVHAAATLLALVGAALAAPAAAPAATATGRIAYVTSTLAKPESQVWTALADGSEPRLLGAGDEPLISPDGATVAAGLLGAGSETGPSFAVYPTSGSPSTRFGDIAKQVAVPVAWSSDSRYLAVILGSTAVKGFAKRSGLGIVDRTTGALRTIAPGIVDGASFAPDASDRIVFGLAKGESFSAPVNLWVAQASGAGLRRLTRDGRSLNPIWGPRYIAYNRQRLRREDAPVYQIWLRPPSGGSPRRLTHIRVPSLVSGLTPLGFSADGRRLLAEFVGQDTSEAWTVQMGSGRARRVRVKGRPVVGSGISRDGLRLLVTEGGLDGPASTGNVLAVPFTGGAPTRLVAHAAEPSWNE